MDKSSPIVETDTMIVEVEKAGVVLLRTDLATVIEMFATGSGTFRPKCAELARELENFWIRRPYQLRIVAAVISIEETVEQDPRAMED